MICKRLEQCVEEELAGAGHAKCYNKNVVCIESSDKRPEVKCEEKKKKYVLQNTMKNYVISYRMDGGIVVLDSTVPEGTSKCDYLYVVNGKERTVILIELKGVDAAKAIKQIRETLINFKDFFKKFEYVYGRVIVAASTPNLKASPEYVKLVKLLKSTYKGNIKIAKLQYIEKDGELSKE